MIVQGPRVKLNLVVKLYRLRDSEKQYFVTPAVKSLTGSTIVYFEGKSKTIYVAMFPLHDLRYGLIRSIFKLWKTLWRVLRVLSKFAMFYNYGCSPWVLKSFQAYKSQPQFFLTHFWVLHLRTFHFPPKLLLQLVNTSRESGRRYIQCQSDQPIVKEKRSSAI